MSSFNKKEVHILLVEDDDVDIKMMKRAFSKKKIANPLTIAKDGLEALELLRADAIPSPFLILMDLNMPRMDGISCIKAIRDDEKLHSCVIFVLTTSKSEEDIIEAYNLNTAGYIIKTDVGDGFLTAVQMLDCYWRIVEFPLCEHSQ